MFAEFFFLTYFLMFYRCCSPLIQSKPHLGILEAKYSGKDPRDASMEGQRPADSALTSRAAGPLHIYSSSESSRSCLSAAWLLPSFLADLSAWLGCALSESGTEGSLQKTESSPSYLSPAYLELSPCPTLFRNLRPYSLISHRSNPRGSGHSCCLHFIDGGMGDKRAWITFSGSVMLSCLLGFPCGQENNAQMKTVKFIDSVVSISTGTGCVLCHLLLDSSEVHGLVCPQRLLVGVTTLRLLPRCTHNTVNVSMIYLKCWSGQRARVLWMRTELRVLSGPLWDLASHLPT